MPRITIVLEWKEGEEIPPADGGWWSPDVEERVYAEGIGPDDLDLRFVAELGAAAVFAAIAAATPRAEDGGYPPDFCDAMIEDITNHARAWRRFNVPDEETS